VTWALGDGCGLRLIRCRFSRNRLAGDRCLPACRQSGRVAGPPPAATRRRSNRRSRLLRHHRAWRCRRHLTAAEGGAGLRSAQKAGPRRWVNRAKRTARRPAPLPEGAMHPQALPTRHQELATLKATRRSGGIATGASSLNAQAADLQVRVLPGAQTCRSRTRSETRPVRLVMASSIAAGHVESAVHLVASPPAQWQRPDCQRDCQRHRGLPWSVARRVVSSGVCGIQRRRAWSKTNHGIKRCLVRYVARQLKTNPRFDAHRSVTGADSSTKQRRLGGRFAPVTGSR
jgi:hypothetical protein